MLLVLYQDLVRIGTSRPVIALAEISEHYYRCCTLLYG